MHDFFNSAARDKILPQSPPASLGSAATGLGLGLGGVKKHNFYS